MSTVVFFQDSMNFFLAYLDTILTAAELLAIFPLLSYNGGRIFSLYRTANPLVVAFATASTIQVV